MKLDMSLSVVMTWFVVPWECAQVYASHPEHRDML